VKCLIIGTKDGAIRVRTTRRRAGDRLKYDLQMLEEMKGLPRTPLPGRDSIDPPTQIGVPEQEITRPIEIRKAEFPKKGFTIEREHVSEHGLTRGCKGCLNADSGNPVAKNHTATCRERFLKIYEEHNQEKLLKFSEKTLETVKEKTREFWQRQKLQLNKIHPWKKTWGQITMQQDLLEKIELTVMSERGMLFIVSLQMRT